jgi:hypothetical protein
MDLFLDRADGQEAGRTVGLPLSAGFAGPDRSIAGGLTGPDAALARLGIQAQPHVSRAVVSKALARSVGLRAASRMTYEAVASLSARSH